MIEIETWLHKNIKKIIVDVLQEVFEDREIFKNEEVQENKELFTIKHFCKKHAFISENGVRKKIFDSRYNGFNKCFSKVGRKVLIKEKEALEYFKNPPPNANLSYQKS
jgi:hypothetical protein